MDQNEYIEALIAKVLSGEVSETEMKEFELWKNASSENLEYFRILEKIYLQAPKARIDKSFDTDAAWQKLKIEIENKKNIKKINPNGNSFSFIRIAASIILIAGLGFAVYKIFNQDKINPVTIASANKTEQFNLPDSTSVFLNRNSKLVYVYSNKRRKAELRGEAFFDLAKDSDRPFELKAGNLIIQDIGTSFNVKAIEGSDSVIVFVESGEVILTSMSNNYINLIKGQKAIYLKRKDQFIKEIVADTNTLAYKTKIFVFENASLISTVQKLNEVYDCNIIIAENIKSCHLTATFRNESADAIIDIIAETLRLKVKRENNKIFLEGEGCED